LNKLIFITLLFTFSSSGSLATQPLTCHSLLNNNISQVQSFNQNRRVGLEIEVYGDQIERITNLYSNYFDQQPSAGQFNFRALNTKPNITILINSKNEGQAAYEIHGEADSKGEYTFFLFEANDYDEPIESGPSAEELRFMAFDMMSTAPNDLEQFEMVSVYTWEVTFINSLGLPELREIIIESTDEKTEVFMFAVPTGESSYIERGLIFSTEEDALNYVQSVLQSGIFYGRVQIPSPFGLVSIVPESSSSELIRSPVIAVEDFATELVLPPVLRGQLGELLAPLSSLSEDSGLIPEDHNINLGLHVNIEFDPQNLKEVVEILLQLHEQYTRFKSSYQKNSSRLTFARPLTDTAVEYLRLLQERERVTLDDLKQYESLLDGDGKYYWLNISHIFDASAEEYRPAIEVRIADSSLNMENIISLVDDIFGLVEEI
jgi:hypothetical protein